MIDLRNSFIAQFTAYYLKVVAVVLITSPVSVIYGQFSPQCSIFDLNDGPILINDFDTISLRINVTDADEIDLLTSFQSVCAIRLHFEHQQLSDLTIAITSPDGRTVTMIGPALPNGTQFSTFPVDHDLIFLPNLSTGINPDPDLESPWTNNLINWGNSSSYGGSYHPYDGDFGGELDTGLVTGIWELTIIDHFLNGEGEFKGFEIEFCEPRGLSCQSCEAFTGEFTVADTLKICEGLNEDLNTYYQAGPTDPSLYVEEFLVYDQNGILELNGINPDLSALSAGIYSVHTFNIDLDHYAIAIPDIGGITRNELIDSIAKPGGQFCMNISDPMILEIIDAGAVTVNINATPENINCSQTTASLVHDANFSFTEVNWFRNNIVQPQFSGMTLIEVDQEGTYKVEITNQYGCIITDSTFIGTDYTIPQATVDAPTIDCLSGAITATFSSVDPLSQTSWRRISDNTVISSSSNAIIGQPGLYDLTLVGVNGCDTVISFEVQSDMELIQVSNVPSGIINLDCANPSISVSPSRDPANIAREYWIFGSADTLNIPADIPLDITITESNSYRYVIEANNGCITNDVRFDVMVDTLAPIYSVVTDSITCAVREATVRLLNLEDEMVTWEPGVTVVVDSIATAASEGIVSFMITDTTNNCSVNDSVLVVRNEEVPNISFFGDSVLTCDLPDASITANYNGSIVQSITWTDSRGSVYTEQSIVISQPGILNVEAIGANGCLFSDAVEIFDNRNTPDIDLPNDVRVSCNDPEFTLSVGNLTGIDSILWIFETDTSIGPQITYETKLPGFEVLAIGENGCVGSKVININHDTLPPIFALISDTINCANDSALIRIDRELTHHDFLWAGPNITGQVTKEVVVDQPGAYALNVTDTLTGCFQLAPVNVVEDFSIPQFSFLSPDTITCTRTSAEISISPSSFPTIVWTTSDGRTLTDATAIIDQPGIQNITITGSNGCQKMDSIEVISDVSPPQLSIENSYVISCQNRQISLEPDITDMYESILWTFEDGQFSSDPIEEINEQDIIESLNVTGLNGCDTVVNFNVTIATDIPKAVINYRDTTICDGEEVIITTDPVVEPEHQISWYNDTGLLEMDLINIPVSSTALYTLEVRDTLSGCQAEDSVNITISSSPIQSLNIDFDNEQCIGDNFGYLHVTGSNGGVGGLQIFVDGIDVGFSPVEPLQPGRYNIEAIDNLGCKLDTALIIESGEQISVDLGPDLSVERGDTITITSQLNGDSPEVTYWISNGDTLSTNSDRLTIEIFEDRIIEFVAITSNGCIARDSIFIDSFVDINKISAVVPNVLNTSSTDGNNLLTVFIPSDILEINDFSIFDRWGGRVAYVRQILSGENVIVWDGKLNGSQVTSGVYVFTYDMLTIYDSQRRIVSGDITVLD